VNGSLRLTLPSDAKAEVEANTVSGGISNDFGLPVSHRFVVTVCAVNWAVAALS